MLKLENKVDCQEKEDGLDWLPAKKIDLPINHENVEYVVNIEFNEFRLKLVDTQVVTSILTANNSEIVTELESQHSDLLPSKYEGI